MKKIRWSVIYSTCLGTGYFPGFPGTIGSLLAFLVYLSLPCTIFQDFSLNLIFTGAIIVLSLISIPVISKAEKYLGHDNGKIVIDEFFGYMVAIAFFPKSLITGAMAFVFFRIFDIWKIEPVNVLQKLPGGWGVMADDIMAGIYTNILVRIIFRIIII